MTKTTEGLLRIIEDLVHDKEKQLQHQLSVNEEDFLITTCTNFVIDNIHKFVSGSLEHADDGGDFLTSVNHKRELYNEMLDAINYLKAMEYKK